ncbi:unnamed protein product [Cylindrotheca closterium]|uniref:Uncharacterized protein n=1 Tax=Cylindrotheca closterium TaxID=2856 RepID=A0AAD2CBZ3_9STRA|nr:unnamed protein product [Cylindrotheca closterium]
MENVFIYRGGYQEVPRHVTRVYIDPSVDEIKNKAFKGCKELREVVFAKDGRLEVIGSFAFMGCESLELIELPKTTKRILCGAFINCSSAKLLILNHGLQEIGLSSFRGCRGLKYALVPRTVDHMAARAFFECTGLEQVAIEKGLTKIHESTFERCTALKMIGLPPSVTRIGSNAIPRETKQERKHWVWAVSQVSVSILKMNTNSGDCLSSQNDDTANLEKEAPVPVSPRQPSQDSTASTLSASKSLTFSQEDDHAEMVNTTASGNLVISREQWDDVNNRLEVAEENVKVLKAQLNTVPTQAKESSSDALCLKVNALEQKLNASVTRFDNESELKTAITSLHQTTTERDELKEEIATMKQCLEALKKGFDLLIEKDQVKHKEIGQDTSYQSEQTKKRSRHDWEDSPVESLGVMGSIKKRILTWSQQNHQE